MRLILLLSYDTCNGLVSKNVFIFDVDVGETYIKKFRLYALRKKYIRFVDKILLTMIFYERLNVE